ncbi:MAG: hypothetical protein KDB37_21250, partial [Ilumatobacter sp.]|nr:hypothetical protein [Ilumatobacter sp.]
LDGWDQGSFVHVEAVGGPFIFGRTNHDTWGTWSRDYDWLKVPEPAATARIAISSRTGTSLHVPPGNEGRGYPSDIIVADVEIWPDGTVTGHTTEKDEP